MEEIRRWFEDDCDNYEIEEYEEHLVARTETAIYMVVAPHNGTDFQWVLRVSTRSAFDRWANSTAIEEFFDTDIEVRDYLYENQLEIHKALLAYLSEKYDELEEATSKGSLFWVSMIIQDKETKPWLCTKSDGFLTLEEAHKEIEFMRTHDRVLAAWIDIHEGNKKTTVFHECYINVFGEMYN